MGFVGLGRTDPCTQLLEEALIAGAQFFTTWPKLSAHLFRCDLAVSGQAFLSSLSVVCHRILLLQNHLKA